MSDGPSTRLDRMVAWCKNNRLISIVLFACVAIIGAAKLKDALDKIRPPKTHSTPPAFTPPEPVTPTPTVKRERSVKMQMGAPELKKCSVEYSASKKGFLVIPADDEQHPKPSVDIYIRGEDPKKQRLRI